jgi:hypothetical protein
MRRLSLFLIVACGVQSLPGRAARADLLCNEPVVTLGEVKAGRPLSYRFTFTNTGSEAVQITAVQPSCGCLNPRVGERRLRPWDTGILFLEVNTLTAPPGPNSWRVQILYSTAGQPHDLTLSLRANVLAEITVQPAALVLQTESAVGHEITICDARPKPITVTSVHTSSSLLSAVLRETKKDEAGRCVFVVRLDVLAGFYDETLQVFTSDPDYPELRVPVIVVKQARSAVRASPAELTVTADGGPLPAKLIRLRGQETQEVVVDRIECDNPAVQCTQAKGPGNMSTLRVQIDGKRIPADGLHTALHVWFSNPPSSELIVPVHCMQK